MRRLILFNGILVALLLVYQQMNISFYNYIHFIPWQPVFTRDHYALISGILFISLCVISIVLWKIFRKGHDQAYIKVMYYEFLIVLILGIVLAIGFIYAVYTPFVPMVTTLDYNRPYLGYGFIYFLELGVLSFLLGMLLKIRYILCIRQV